MITVNSLSGGKTSSYMAVHFPADIELFSLVRTSDLSCKFKDDSIRKIVEDKIEKNKLKYPVEKSKSSAKKYNEI